METRSYPGLDSVKIAKPCPILWSQMTGDERKRFCASCKQNVYNIAEMTRAEAETLLTKAEESICVSIFRRADGTILTADCPVGLALLRSRVNKYLTAFVASLIGLWGAFGVLNWVGNKLMIAIQKDMHRQTGMMLPRDQSTPPVQKSKEP